VVRASDKLSVLDCANVASVACVAPNPLATTEGKLSIFGMLLVVVMVGSSTTDSALAPMRAALRMDITTFSDAVTLLVDSMYLIPD